MGFRRLIDGLLSAGSEQNLQKEGETADNQINSN